MLFSTMLSLSDIQQAELSLQGRCRRTPLLHSSYFSEGLGQSVYLKCENLQRTGSFKIRGASHFLSQQDSAILAQGVITASAGNHAQGVALAARLSGIPATVVMPDSTPLAKVLATQHYGAEVVLCGSSYDEAAEKARHIQTRRGQLFVPAFDHPLIMAGQGTIALEILADLPEISQVLVPVGGGGLIAGVATTLKSLRPEVRVIGVEAAGAPSARLSRQRGNRVNLADARSLADGIVVKQLGELTYPIIESLVDDLVLVEEEEIAQAIVGLLEKGKLVVEGAGAVSLAALLYGRTPNHVGPTVCLLSGGNIDVQTLDRVVQRGMMAEGRFLKVRVELEDSPGALASLATLLGKVGANILHVSHDRRQVDLALERAVVHLELETRGPKHIEQVLQALAESAYGAEILR